MTAADRRLLESFGKALAAQKLNLVYQPKVSLKDGRLTRVEALVLHPDLIVLNKEPRDAADQGSYNHTHPALDALYPPSRRIILPTRYTLCGGPELFAAFDYLAGLLSRLVQSPTMRNN